MKHDLSENYNNSLVLLIAGSSTRFSADGSVKKQFLLVNDKPLFIHTLANLKKSNIFDCIVVVCQEEFKSDVTYYVAEHCTDIKNVNVNVVLGGKDRVESVYNAMCFLAGSLFSTDYVFIHDGVRPVVSKDEILSLQKSVVKYDAAILAMKMTDTVKQVDKNGMIVQTLDRSMLYRAATPQAFAFSKYYNAISKCIAEDNNTIVTDDAQIYSMYQEGDVAVVPCSSKNIKITTQDDVSLIF